MSLWLMSKPLAFSRAWPPPEAMVRIGQQPAHIFSCGHHQCQLASIGGREQKQPMRGGVLTEKRGAVLIITINRPAVRNAMNAESARALSNALDALDSDPGVQLGILTGAGAFFSAGADLKVAAETGSSGAVTERGAMGMCALPPGKLLIAAIEGGAVGGGLEMALACDLIVAAHDAKLGLPEVRRGMVAMGGGLLRLPSRIAPNIATEVAVTRELKPTNFFYRHGPGHRV